MNRLPIQKTEHCASEEDLLRYATDAFPPEGQSALEAHLASCLFCLARSAEVHRMAETARQEACARIVPRLSSYLQSKQEGREIEEVRTHLLVCQDCFARYNQLVEAHMQAEWEDWVPAQRSTVARQVVEMVLGLVRNFPALSPRWIPATPALRPAAQGAEPAPLRVENWQELVGEGITAVMALDARDHLLVALESERYEVGQVRVSLSKTTDDAIVPVKTVVTDSQGQADFGSVAEVERPAYEGYLLVIDELSEHSPHTRGE